MSLDRLAQRSGISRAALGQIELGQSTPTINVLWKLARALGVAFSALITARVDKGSIVLRDSRDESPSKLDNRLVSRALFPFDEPRRVEFYELRLPAGSEELVDPHAPGTVGNLVVGSGTVEISVDDDINILRPGDAIFFETDVPHAYRNQGSIEAVLYLVITYADRV